MKRRLTTVNGDPIRNNSNNNNNNNRSRMRNVLSQCMNRLRHLFDSCYHTRTDNDLEAMLKQTCTPLMKEQTETEKKKKKRKNYGQHDRDDLGKEEEEEENEEDYNLVRMRLSSMVTRMNPFERFDTSNITFLCHSSSRDTQIYICNDKYQFNRQYIMKVTRLTNRRTVRNVENEISLMSSCDHPNIIKLDAVYYYDNHIAIVIDYYKHGSLTRVIDRFSPLTEAQIAYISKQILEALAYLHEQKYIIHLDIKSDNILVNNDYSIVISDFGLSKQLSNPNETYNQMRGTCYWMAPEVIDQQPVYTSKADIWSFGILVWEMVFGKPPRSHMDCSQVLNEIKYSAAPELPQNSHYSNELRDFISKALNKDASQRWNALQLLKHDFIELNASNVSELFSDYEQQAIDATCEANEEAILANIEGLYPPKKLTPSL